MKKMTIKHFENLVRKNFSNIKISCDEKFSSHTTFRIGGKIKLFLEVSSEKDAVALVKLAREKNMPYFILGAGSNILASDSTHNLVVIKVNLLSIKRYNDKIICGSGVNLYKLNAFAMQNNLSGLEWSYGIPGSVGGSVKMNAGAFGGEMGQVVDSVYYTDGKHIYRKSNKALSFGYRQSYFSGKNFLILKVVFKLSPSGYEKIHSQCLENFAKRIKSQPYNQMSAGSVFRKPKEQFAPVLIEKSGLKGTKCGQAEISSKHCGFIVNLGGATFNQVFRLICKIKKTVLKKFDIMLQEEVIILKNK